MTGLPNKHSSPSPSHRGRGILSRTYFILTIFLIFSSFLYAEESSSKKILENGLTVLIKEMPASDVVSVYALVKAGSATEG